MDEYMFGVTSRKLSAAKARRRAKICREEGGKGYIQCEDPNGQWTGWFVAPNDGEPFDSALARRVMARVRTAEGWDEQ